MKEPTHPSETDRFSRSRKSAGNRMKLRNKKRLKVILVSFSGGLLMLVLLLMMLVKPCDTYADRGFAAIDPQTQKLANTYCALWNNPPQYRRQLTALHRMNPEWDFMFRTYCVLAFANLALHEPDRQGKYLDLIDAIIDDTLELEKTNGFRYFLMTYGQSGNWILRPARSQFVDGEIALMLAVRCLIENNFFYSRQLDKRVTVMADRMNQSPVLCAESYPDECWVFCNTITLAAIKIADRVNGTDHDGLCRRWIVTAKTCLIDKQSGLLRSAFTADGTPVASAKGPEGSSIWMTCHMLQFVDPAFAEEQYKTACRELMDSVCGFGYSREWPKTFQGSADIDSGPVVPILNASPSASGLALIAATAFKDRANFNRLTRSLNTFAFPTEDGDRLRYRLSNPLSDAVILYGLTAGPVLGRFKDP